MIRTFVIAACCVALLLQGCSSKKNVITLSGATMGTTWSVVLPSADNNQIKGLRQRIVDELLRINQLMSTYQDDSELSLFNANASTEFTELDLDTLRVLDTAIAVSAATNGSYDVTLGNIIKLWGFGSDGAIKTVPTQQQLQQAAQTTGYQRISRDGARVAKSHPQLRIDLSSLAKGFAVDQIGELVEAAGVQHYLAEIGGEIRTRGQRANNTPWLVGIETPDLTVKAGLAISNAHIASSGTYRQYREVDGKRVSHLIDGNTLAPITHNTAAATVVHSSTMLADAWATALIVLKPEAAKALALREGFDAQLTLKVGEGFEVWRTPGFSALIADNPGAKND